MGGLAPGLCTHPLCLCHALLPCSVRSVSPAALITLGAAHTTHCSRSLFLRPLFLAPLPLLQAVVNIISNPVNSTVPISAEVLKAAGKYDARKVSQKRGVSSSLMQHSYISSLIRSS